MRLSCRGQDTACQQWAGSSTATQTPECNRARPTLLGIGSEDGPLQKRNGASMILRARGRTSAGPVGQAREQWPGQFRGPPTTASCTQSWTTQLRRSEECLGPCTTQGCRDRPWATHTHLAPKPLQCLRPFPAHLLPPRSILSCLKFQGVLPFPSDPSSNLLKSFTLMVPKPLPAGFWLSNLQPVASTLLPSIHFQTVHLPASLQASDSFFEQKGDLHWTPQNLKRLG